MKFSRTSNQPAFTLIELVISMAILAALGGAIIFFINPAQELARSRNNQRKSDVISILNVAGQNISDHNGSFSCVSGPLPTSTALKMAISAGTSTYDIAQCLVPNYLPSMPYDPKTGGAHYSSVTDYDTGYYIQRDATTSRVTVSAPSAELGETISYTR